MKLRFCVTALLGLALAGCAHKAPVSSKPTAAIEKAPAPLTLVPRTYTARTDDIVEQLPPATPSMGGLLGQNQVFTDPRFRNARTLRATDGATGFKPGQTLQTADGGAPTLWASDSQHILTQIVGGRTRVIAFDGAKFQVANTPIFIFGDPVFSWGDPRVMFSLQGTAVHKITAAADWQSLESDVVLFDFASCLPAGFKMTWGGSFTAKRDDRTFVVAFSDTGGQGSGHYVVGYRVGKGCTVIDTLAGTVRGQWGASGIVDDGTNPLADRFTLHEAGGGQNEHYAQVGASLHQPGGADGCVAGGCRDNAPYIWEIGTTHLRICGGHKCDGHQAKGYLHIATGKQFTLHNYSDPTTPLTPTLRSKSFCSDMHGTWNNSTRKDVNPLFAVTSDVGGGPPYPCAGYNEVIGAPVDGSGVRYRFGQTFNTGRSRYFAVQNAIGVVDQSGRWVLFSSDWLNTLGTEADGKTPRGDVFILELK